MTPPSSAGGPTQPPAVEVVGPWPDLGLAEDAIERLPHATAGELGASPSLSVEHAEFTHYGSGYPSFVASSLRDRRSSSRTGPGMTNPDDAEGGQIYR